MTKTSRKLLSFFIGIFISIIVIGGIFFFLILKNNIQSDQKTDYIYVSTTDTYDDVMTKLKQSNRIKNFSIVKLVAKLSHYEEKIHAGRYELTPGLSTLKLIQKLSQGRQTPVRITFSNNIRTQDALAKKITEKLMMTETDFLATLNSEETLSKYNLTKENIIVLFLPNTYEVYWNITPEEFINKMKKEYDKFWNNERLEKLKDCGLTQAEVSTLAAIVEEETLKTDERPDVAGVYLNRLRIGMRLQADPTVKFALGDFSIQRIRGILDIESPYNTYKYEGLPPGPIRVVSTDGIDAVLNYTHHNYIYFCAKEDFSGYHNFAATYEKHRENASKYHDALNKRNIY